MPPGPMLVRFVLMVTVATLILGGLHYYLYLRFGRYLGLGPTELRLLRAALLALFALLWVAMPLGRMLPRAVASPLLWVAFVWLGTLVVCSVVLAGSDLLLLFGGLGASLKPDAIDPERRQLLRRWVELGTLGTAGVLSGYALFQGLRKVAVRRVSVRLAKLPAELSGLRIVQLTDVHIGPTLDGKWLGEVVKQVNALQADLVVITGDLVDGSLETLRSHVQPLSELRAKHGIYFVTGNHEYYAGVDAWLAELSRLGLRVLRNERVTLQPLASAPHALLDLIGIDDHHSGVYPGHGPDLPRALAGRDTKNPALLLAHQPAAIVEAAQLGIDLQLSGHTHGGQLWPWGHLVRLQQPYIAGLHTRGQTQIYVSSGTGYWGPPMRLGSPAEITELTLLPAVA